MLVRAILPMWAADEYPSARRIIEGDFSDDELLELNAAYYNIHNLPNHPSEYKEEATVDGSHIDVFKYVFIDFDLKSNTYPSKETFLAAILEDPKLEPSKIIDSGNGIHAYWAISDLDAMNYLRFQRRLMRKFKTDEAVAKIFQLMRPPGFVNTKHKDGFKPVELLLETEKVYTCEELDRLIPQITQEDEAYCKNHYSRTYRLPEDVKVDDKMPLKFAHLLRGNKEVEALWAQDVEDRSKADFRIGHIMFGNGFTKPEAMSVLVNSAKALERAPVHRISYAQGIIDKIWTFELAQDKESLNLSSSVKDILQRHEGDTLKGTRFPCWSYIDATYHGFRLGQVIGLVAGIGVGKTAMALNMFEGFVQNNPDYTHFFIPLEQPAKEIADRWKTMCGTNTERYEKVHIMSNYDEDGNFRHLSLDEIKDYLLKFQKVTGKKIGCVVIDHIGVLKKKGKDGENQDLMDICHQMKAFAIQTNTMVVMQSQTSREKAGSGDLELDKDAAYGTMYFEAYCDYLITIWQPLKRCYDETDCPPVTAFKFCKIRHKKMNVDNIKEDVRYLLKFDPQTERMSEITQTIEDTFKFYNNKATNKRKQDRKTEVTTYQSIGWSTDGKDNTNQDPNRAE